MRPIDSSKYISFIEENGTDLEKARFRQLFYGVQPEPGIVQPLLELQNDDGGFPCKMTRSNPSSVNDTLRALWWMAELGMIESPAAGGAFGYLFAIQKADGGWDEHAVATQYGTPPWANPGDLRARLYLTAQTAHWLAVGGYKTHPAFHKALDFLLEHRDETGKFYGFLHTTWIATSVFVMAGDEYADIVAGGLRALMARPLSEWVDSQISWALELLGKAGLPKDEPFIEQGLAELLRRQEVNGRWVSEDGEAYTVVATIGALNALKHYDLLEI